MKPNALSAMLLVLPACAGQPPAGAGDQDYRRADSRIETTEDFERLQRACAAHGGAVVLPRESGGRVPPTLSELRKASCTMPSRAAVSF